MFFVFRTLVEGNVTNGNGDDGINVDNAFSETTLTENIANNNADLGIEAEWVSQTAVEILFRATTRFISPQGSARSVWG